MTAMHLKHQNQTRASLIPFLGPTLTLFCPRRGHVCRSMGDTEIIQSSSTFHLDHLRLYHLVLTVCVFTKKPTPVSRLDGYWHFQVGDSEPSLVSKSCFIVLQYYKDDHRYECCSRSPFHNLYRKNYIFSESFKSCFVNQYKERKAQRRMIKSLTKLNCDCLIINLFKHTFQCLSNII